MSNSKQKFRGSHEKLAKFCMVEITDSVDFFRRKTANRSKFLDLVSRNVGHHQDIKISAAHFISANYQHLQNLQNRSVNTLKQQITRTEQETFEQFSLRMSQHKFAAYLDDNCLR